MTRVRRQPPASRARPQDIGSKVPFLVPAAIFLLALAVRLVHLWQIREAPFFAVLFGDARGYDQWGRQIAAGDWIGKEVFYQAPMYPYFLGTIYALLGHSLVAVRAVQAVIGASACLLLALAGRRFFSPPVGVAAGVGLALYAPAIFFDGLIQKSVLDVFFVCLSLWILSGLVERSRGTFVWLGLGVALGGLSLTRENALVLIAVIAVWAVLRLWPERQASPASTLAAVGGPLAAFGLGLAIVLVPVAVRNYAVGGGFYLTTSQFGPNFYIGNNPKARGGYVPLREGRGAPEYERQDATELAEAAAHRTLSPAEVSSYWTGRALDYITSQPGAWLRLMSRKFVLLWNATESADTESQESYAEWSTPLKLGGWLGHFGVLVPLALLGMWAAWPEWRRLWVLYALTVAYSASVLVFYVFARYRFPLVPLLMLFAANGVIALPDLVRGALGRERSARPSNGVPRRRSTRAITAAVAAVAIFANWPVLSANVMQSVTENSLGTALQEAGQLDEAIVHYRRAIELSPSDAPYLANLGTALRLKGDAAGAVVMYGRALALDPGSASTNYDLANALMDLHRVDEAISHFAAAASAAPDSVDVQNNYGVALVEAGRTGEAITAFEKALAGDPGSSKAHRNLGDVLSAVGRNDEAVVHLRRAAEIDPADASLHYDLASTLLEMKRLSDAVAEFRRAIALQPGMEEAHNNLGIALSYQGKTDEAIAEFQTALKLKPDAADARRNLEQIARVTKPK